MAIATAVAPPPAEATLSDVMLAMDVVDTLRHREAIVDVELHGDARRAQMIQRLREIYASQGITVPDRILEEGVAALEQERFVYKPRTGGFSFTLARLYVTRARWGRMVAIGAGVIVVALAAWIFLVQQPAQRREANLQVELSETIPNTLRSLSQQVVALAVDPAVDAAAEETAADGLAAAAAGNAPGARAAIASLEGTLAELQLTYEVRIVNEDPGLFRIPDANPAARNYYIIVEAIGPGGQRLARTITSEEDQSTRSVTRWGIRVPQSVYDDVATDARDDGIVQNALVGVKTRGELDVDWRVPVLGGAITDLGD
ncbi:MAG: hypothetical protein KIT43_00065 [Bauldia sp.]|nr:hypothetical protein [Bauldia sp.]